MQKMLLLCGLILLLVVLLLGFHKAALRKSITHQSSSPSVTNAAMLSMKGTYEITTEQPLYYDDTKGFLAMPKKQGSYPGVVMIHEWWGLNDNIKDMAKNLASQGYIVLAVDLYHGQVAKTSQEATEQVSDFDQDDGIQNMQKAVEYLRSKGATKIASLGWCFGGGQSLALALSGETLDATILYYGTPLVTDPAQLGRITWPVLGFFGDKDQAISSDQQKTFKESLTSAQVVNEVYIYPGLGHAFANPSSATYAPTQTKDAWEKTLTFLQKYLKS